MNIENRMNTENQSIDELIEQLRQAGPEPTQELLAAITSLGAEAVPALIALVSDPAAYDVIEAEEDVSGWAPYPAVTILGELHPAEALEPLLDLIRWDGYDFLTGVVPEALARYGAAALDPLASILGDGNLTVWTRIRASSALEKTAHLFPELRDQIVATLTAQLDTDEPDNQDLDTVRTFLIGDLVELQATESIPSIIRAFESTRIDPFVIDWSDVCMKLNVSPDVAPHLDRIAPRRGSLIGDHLWSQALTPHGQPVAPVTTAHSGGVLEPYRRETRKVGRNDPCPCGSGKKYKKCHGK